MRCSDDKTKTAELNWCQIEKHGKTLEKLTPKGWRTTNKRRRRSIMNTYAIVGLM